MIARRLILATFCTMAGVLLFASSPAMALNAHVFSGSFGSGSSTPANPYPLSEPTGVAVDGSSGPSAGDVYVADTGNHRVEKFDSSGNFLLAFGANVGGLGVNVCGGLVLCTAGTPGSGPGQFEAPKFVAVDGSTGPSKGDVYVGDTGDNLVTKFTSEGALIESWGIKGQLDGLVELGGIAVDTAGTLGVLAENQKLFEFAQDGVPATPPDFGIPRGSSPAGLAVDSGGNFFKLNGTPSVEEFGPSGTDIGQVSVSETSTGLAVDPSTGTLYVDNAGTEIDQYAFDLSGNVVEPDGSTCAVKPEVGCNPTGSFGSGDLSGAAGLALDSSGTLYAADAAADDVAVFDQVVLPDVTTGEATELQTEGSATLNGTVNPDGVPVTSCEFEYVTASEYEPGAPNPYAKGTSVPCEASPGKGTATVPVKAEIKGLTPDTVYHYRLVAGNAHGKNETSKDMLFTAPTRPTVDSESVTEVTASSAKLGAAVNPGGAATTYQFDYGTTAAYGQNTPEASSIGSDGAAHPASAEIQGLQPDTTYHYRVVVTNLLETVDGRDQTFTTQPSAGSGHVLPDGRAWELVSPVETLGAQVIPTNRALSQASEDGDAISYYLSAPFVANPAGNVEVAQAISKRGPSGWSTEDIATPHDGPITPGNDRYGEYMFFSPDLSHALVQPFGETPLSSEATEGTPYVRDDTAGVYTPVVTPEDVLPGTEFGHDRENGAQATFVTASPDLSHVVLGSRTALTSEDANDGNGFIYYEWAGGQLRLISALPSGPKAPSEVQIGGRANTRRAVSSDGSRVFWSTTEPSHVYMTDMTDGEVVRLDKAQGVAEPNNNQSEYQIASSDGSLVFFRDGAQLTASPGGGLYAYNVQTGKLALVTVPVHGNDEFTGSVLGSSEDGSYVYLMDRSVLSEAPNAEQEKALEGGDNLYVLHREVLGSAEVWTPSFITTLSADDANDWRSASESPSGESSQQTVEVSRNGRYVAFMSDRSLTGYDNRDASSGEPDEEVYLYQYDGAGTRLVCASCNPTGARPSGWREPEGDQSPLSDLTQAWQGRWVAATIPGPTETDSRSNLSPYEPTYLTESGRLFFDSRDALVPQDVNGVGDLYEYEPGGVGSCAADGCVALLSGGTGPDESAFVDASVSGDDVFFVTTDRLVTQDVGTAHDLYDAHVCSAEAPCPSSVLVAPVPCSTADACKSAPAPQPALFGAPPSATFNGAGNLAPTPAATVKPKAKPLTRAQKLANALKACGKKPKRKRPACRKQARKQYGPIHKAKKTDRRGQS